MISVCRYSNRKYYSEYTFTNRPYHTIPPQISLWAAALAHRAPPAASHCRQRRAWMNGQPTEFSIIRLAADRSRATILLWWAATLSIIGRSLVMHAPQPSSWLATILAHDTRLTHHSSMMTKTTLMTVTINCDLRTRLTDLMRLNNEWWSSLSLFISSGQFFLYILQINPYSRSSKIGPNRSGHAAH